MGWYDRYVLPRVLDATCGMKIVGEQRAKVVGLARGVVLEPGIGGGLNLPFYRPSAVSKLIGVDPSVELGSRAIQRSASVPFPVELWSQSAEVDVVAPESVDTVVFTYTLCSVPAPERLLAAAHRALKPDGMLVFCEHSCAPDESVRRWQKRIEPVWKALAGGCHLTRNAVRQLEDTGFIIDALEQHYVEQVPRFAGFHQIGRASKASSARGERANVRLHASEGPQSCCPNLPRSQSCACSAGVLRCTRERLGAGFLCELQRGYDVRAWPAIHPLRAQSSSGRMGAPPRACESHCANVLFPEPARPSTATSRRVCRPAPWDPSRSNRVACARLMALRPPP